MCAVDTAPTFPYRKKPSYYLVSSDALDKLLGRCTNCGAQMVTERCNSAGGSTLIVSGLCPSCLKEMHWRSSEFVEDTRVAHVDLLLSACIMFSGMQISQALRLFEFMGAPVITSRTYHNHQSTYLHKVSYHIYSWVL